MEVAIFRLLEFVQCVHCFSELSALIIVDTFDNFHCSFCLFI